MDGLHLFDWIGIFLSVGVVVGVPLVYRASRSYIGDIVTGAVNTIKTEILGTIETVKVDWDRRHGEARREIGSVKGFAEDGLRAISNQLDSVKTERERTNTEIKVALASLTATGEATNRGMLGVTTTISGLAQSIGEIKQDSAARGANMSDVVRRVDRLERERATK